jgi:hypothetical protein
MTLLAKPFPLIVPPIKASKLPLSMEKTELIIPLVYAEPLTTVPMSKRAAKPFPKYIPELLGT